MFTPDLPSSRRRASDASPCPAAHASESFFVKRAHVAVRHDDAMTGVPRCSPRTFRPPEDELQTPLRAPPHTPLKAFLSSGHTSPSGTMTRCLEYPDVHPGPSVLPKTSFRRLS